MADPILHVGMTAACAHQGQATHSPGSSKVKVDGQPAAKADDMTSIAGCPYMQGTAPSPCVSVTWITQATRVKIEGQFALLQSSSTLCESGAKAPQGPLSVTAAQTKVKAV